MKELTIKTGGTSRNAICSTLAENKRANSSPQATANNDANKIKTTSHRCIGTLTFLVLLSALFLLKNDYFPTKSTKPASSQEWRLSPKLHNIIAISVPIKEEAPLGG
ncbi:MAG: hypothetical protein ACRD2P_03915 [Terriglobia bacterium]